MKKLHVPAIKFTRVEAVGLSVSNYTFKSTIFVRKPNLRQFREKNCQNFVNKRLIISKRQEKQFGRYVQTMDSKKKKNCLMIQINIQRGLKKIMCNLERLKIPLHIFDTL